VRDALLGATGLGAFCIALFFVRFWRETRDPLHACFAASFALLGAQRFMLVVWNDPSEASPALYLPRLLAYVLIIVAVVGKNVGPRPRA
jgi:hypothetical protein